MTEEELMQSIRDYGMRDLTGTVQVVRCEDCNKSNEWVNGRWCQRFCTLVNTDSYCSFGEKRKERRKE